MSLKHCRRPWSLIRLISKLYAPMGPLFSYDSSLELSAILKHGDIAIRRDMIQMVESSRALTFSGVPMPQALGQR